MTSCDRVYARQPAYPLSAASARARTASTAGWVAEYYPTLSQEEVGEDLRVRLTARDDAWLARLVLGCGGHAVLEAPQPAVDAVRARALAALSGYPA